MKSIGSLLFVFMFFIPPLPAHANEQEKALSRLSSDLHQLKDKYDIPAMAVIIVNSDNILMTDVSGLADRKSAKPVTTHSIFRIGSITKMFTSMAMLMLQEDGLLNLDMSVYDIIPAIPVQNSWQKTHPLKISHLLEHTAGLLDLSRAEFDQNTPMTLTRALQWKAAERRTHWPPGEHYSYSNVGAGLAAYIIEHVSHQAYEDFVKQRIFTPLSMASASFYDDARTRSQLVTGYDEDAHTVIPYWHVLYRAFGGINVRPVDMAPFLQLLINKGIHGKQRLLTAESIARMETPGTSLAARNGLKYGYGLGNYTSLRNGLLFHGHGGDADGYLARLGYNRDTNLAYFVVINAFNNNALSAIRHRIQDYITRGQIAIAPPRYKLSDARLFAYSGTYKRITHRFSERNPDRDRLFVSIHSGNLLVKYKNQNKLILPVNAFQFRDADQNQATSAFVSDDEGQLFYQSDDGAFLKIRP